MRGASRDHSSSGVGLNAQTWARVIARAYIVAGDEAVHRGRSHTPTEDVGGASRDRTGDLLVANQTLSQLSYGPYACASAWAPLAYEPGGSGRSCTSDLTLIRGAL